MHGICFGPQSDAPHDKCNHLHTHAYATNWKSSHCPIHMRSMRFLLHLRVPASSDGILPAQMGAK